MYYIYHARMQACSKWVWQTSLLTGSCTMQSSSTDKIFLFFLSFFLSHFVTWMSTTGPTHKVDHHYLPADRLFTMHKHNPRYSCKHATVTNYCDVTVTFLASRAPIVMVLLTNCLLVRQDPWRSLDEAETSGWVVEWSFIAYFSSQYTHR